MCVPEIEQIGKVQKDFTETLIKYTIDRRTNVRYNLMHRNESILSASLPDNRL